MNTVHWRRVHCSFMEYLRIHYFPRATDTTSKLGLPFDSTLRYVSRCVTSEAKCSIKWTTSPVRVESRTPFFQKFAVAATHAYFLHVSSHIPVLVGHLERQDRRCLMPAYGVYDNTKSVLCSHFTK